MKERQLIMRYIGYHDRTMVPYRCLPRARAVYPSYTEEELRNILCTVHKIGNGAIACNIVPNTQDSKDDRRVGLIKRNHHVFYIVATISEEDVDLICNVMERKTSIRPAKQGGGQGLETALPCAGGFCD